ncbi:MAG: hypothetical protein NTZ83_03315 [Candidatus Pacearchaeota archaeon]|nr:hypothetical protein [Candidatus Pacearchaeota archaeon]
MKDDYLIANPSEKLIMEAFGNLPVKPESIYLYFLANGIKAPDNDPKPRELENYLRSCQHNKIVPFSSQTIDYTSEVDRSLTREILGMKTFFENGRANEVLVNMKEEGDLNISSIFNVVILPALSKNNYKISQGHITLLGYDFSDFEGGGSGRLEDVGLYLNWDGYKGLKLSVNQNYEDIDKTNYFKWFEGLKKKHSIKE